MSDGDEALNFFEARAEEVLRGKITAFRRMMLGTFAIALSVFYFLVLPYVASHTARSELLRESGRLNDEIEHLELVAEHHEDLEQRVEQAGEFAYVMRGELIDSAFHGNLDVLAEAQRESIATWRSRLEPLLDDEPGAAAWVRGEAATPQLTSVTFQRFRYELGDMRGPCSWLDVEPWKLCRIGAALTEKHDRILGILGLTQTDLSRGFEMRTLRGSLDEQIAVFAAWATDPDVSAAEQIGSARQLLSRELDGYEQLLVDGHGELRRVRAEIDADLAARRSALGDTAARIERAQARLDQVRRFETIETPVGELPIGLDDLVLLYPALLMAIVYYLVTQLEHAVRLRRAVHGALLRQSRNLPAAPNRYLRLTSSLWLEPLDERPRQIVQAAVLALPLVTALVAAFLVADGDFLFSAMVVPSLAMRVVYVVGYAATFSFVAAAAVRLFDAAETYRIWARDSSESLHATEDEALQ